MQIESMTVSLNATVICAVCESKATESEVSESRCSNCGIRWVESNAVVENKEAEKLSDIEATVKLLPRDATKII